MMLRKEVWDLRHLLNLRTPCRRYSNRWRKLKYSYSYMPGDTVLSHATLGQLLDEAASDVGDQTAFISVHQNIEKTFSQFKHEVDKLASGLISLGLQKGDRIGICAPNVYEWPVTQFATAKAGLIMVNINPAYQPNELEYCLKKVGCKALITSEIFKTQNFYNMLCSFIPELPNSTPGKLQSKIIPSLEAIILISKKAESGTITFDDVLDAGKSESRKLLEKTEKLIQFDDPVNIQYTSGTTGNAKAATLTHHNIVNNVLMSGKRLGYHLQKPKVCCQVPLFHCFGCVLGTLGTVLYQHTCVFPSPSFDAEASIKCIETERCSDVYGTPTMFVDMLSKYKPETNNISSLNKAVIGGAACPENVLKEINKKLQVKEMHCAYGSTENSPAVAVSGLNDDSSRVLMSKIKPLEYVELKVVNNTGQLLPINTDGELYARGHILFMGYWGDKEKTQEVVDETNWYHTGDLAKIDEDGYVKIIGRIKDMVIRGGENLYPVEIENFLHKHPSILEVHIFGVPDKRMGEELCAWVNLKDGEKLTEDDIKDYCKGKISHFKVPRYIMFVDDFPKTVSGKIQKFKMREDTIKELQL